MQQCYNIARTQANCIHAWSLYGRHAADTAYYPAIRACRTWHSDLYLFAEHRTNVRFRARCPATCARSWWKKISLQNFSYIQQANPSVLLTNITSDADAIKIFVSQAVVFNHFLDLYYLSGVTILLIGINWRLALIVLTIIPIVGGTFFFSYSARSGRCFLRTQAIIDRLNNVINESILGASLIRVLNSQQYEYEKIPDGQYWCKKTTAWR